MEEHIVPLKTNRVHFFTNMHIFNPWTFSWFYSRFVKTTFLLLAWMALRWVDLWSSMSFVRKLFGRDHLFSSNFPTSSIFSFFLPFFFFFSSFFLLIPFHYCKQISFGHCFLLYKRIQDIRRRNTRPKTPSTHRLLSGKCDFRSFPYYSVFQRLTKI